MSESDSDTGLDLQYGKDFHLTLQRKQLNAPDFYHTSGYHLRQKGLVTMGKNNS